MTSLENDNMDCDSGVSDMTCSESTVSDRTVSTVIGSPPASIADNFEDRVGHSDTGSIHFPNTVLDGRSVLGSAVSPDCGRASGSVSSHQLPDERLDSATWTQEWVDTRSSAKVNVGNLENDLDSDSGVSDMTSSGSSAGNRTMGTMQGSLTSPLATKDETINGYNGSVLFPNTMLHGQSTRHSVLSADNGISSGSFIGSVKSRDSGISSGSVSGSVKSRDSGISSGSVSGSVKSRDSGISSASDNGSVKSNDSGISNASVIGSVKSNVSGISSGSVSGSVKSNVSGISSGSVIGSVKSNVSGISSGSVSGSVKSRDSGISSGSVSGSVKSNDSGISSGSVSGSVKSNHSGISSGSVSGSVKSNHIGISSGSVSGSVKSNDSGISSGSVSGSVKSRDSGISIGSNNDTQLPKARLDSATKTLDWVKTSEFEVLVKTMDGKTVPITVEADEQVVSFRKKVEEKTKVPESQQYLVSAAGRKLMDGERLSTYNIEKYSTIYCQGRLRGGH